MVEMSLKLRAGEMVEVRTLDEVRSTLDAQGCLDFLPFMPEMARFCGQRFRVHASAHRPCVETLGKQQMEDTVWLTDLRCDGSGHDGCQIGCLIFWKEAWLKRVDAAESRPSSAPGKPVSPWPYPIKDEQRGRYLCQSTSLAQATGELGLWDNLSSHVKDVSRGNLSLSRLLKVIFVALSLRLFGRYGSIKEIRGEGKKTPAESLDLQPGDIVEVKTPDEIRPTLDVNRRNRGLEFNLELLDFCGRRYEVLRRLDKFIDETSGQMRLLKNSVILKEGTCSGIYRRGCMRRGNIIWREVWLKRTAAVKK